MGPAKSEGPVGVGWQAGVIRRIHNALQKSSLPYARSCLAQSMSVVTKYRLQRPDLSDSIIRADLQLTWAATLRQTEMFCGVAVNESLLANGQLTAATGELEPARWQSLKQDRR